MRPLFYICFMQNINIANHKMASDFDINNIAEYLLIKVIKRINDSGRIIDGDLADFVLTEDGFVIVYGDCEEMFDVYDMVKACNGQSILRSIVLFNPNTAKFDAIIKQIPSTDSYLSKHIISASIEHKGDFIYYSTVTRVRNIDL